MKNATGIKTAGLVLLVPILLGFWAGAVHAQWTRLAFDGGGVGMDVQHVRLSDNSLADIVWSANMEGGFFRATWSEDSWGTWTEYLPGRFAFGQDAIYLGSLESTECVLAATGTMGIWYKGYPTAGGEWPRPNGYLYPDTWDSVFTHDVAFFRNTNGTWPQSPEDSFFVILRDTVFVGNNQNPGIYRWRSAPNNDFYRVDAANNNDPSRDFSNFWRDLGDGNVLYVTSPDGIYKLYGSYTRPKFEKLPPGTRLEDLPVDLPQQLLKKLPPLTRK